MRRISVLHCCDQVNIFDVEAFDAEVSKLGTPAAQADTIAHRVKRTVTENMEKDPAFYTRFSKLIDETIRAYREGRLNEAEYLQRVTKIMHTVQLGKDASIPEKLGRYEDAPAYYGVIHDQLVQYNVGGADSTPDDLAADVAIRLEEIIEERKIRDWTTSLDQQNEMKREMEDYLYGVKDHYDIPLKGGDMDVILDSVIDVAKQRDRM